MFFYASKILGALLWPSSIVILVLVAGAALSLFERGHAWGRRLTIGGVSLLLALGLSPIGNWLMLPLEQRFARGALPAELAGIIMLGGFEVAGISRERRQLSLNEGAERLTEAVLAARERPTAKVVFTGGDGSLIGSDGSAVEPIAAFLEALGIERERIVLEGASRTTHENAYELARLLRPQPGQSWLLVTSAFHMPRSVGTFRRAGFDVVAWPADYRTRGPGASVEGFAVFHQGLERVDLAVKEWLGLVAYRLSGRTDALWPSPTTGPDGRLGSEHGSGPRSGAEPLAAR
jgi:uncharacterized SAM-binding protein YcdF (DUF218 family)